MKKLIIMRGLPGSGKSTKANQLAKENGGVICSADHYFINDQGEYRFDPSKIKDAHRECKASVKLAMEDGHPVIILDNTNTQKWEYEPYIGYAYTHGYEVEIVTVGNLTDIDLYSKRNVHNVSHDAIRRMADRFEKLVS